MKMKKLIRNVILVAAVVLCLAAGLYASKTNADAASPDSGEVAEVEADVEMTGN